MLIWELLSERSEGGSPGEWCSWGGGVRNRAHSVGGSAASSRNGFCGHFTLILFDICQFYQILVQNCFDNVCEMISF